MKAILSMALVFVVCGLTGAQSDKVDPIGTWKCEYKMGDQMRTLELTIKKDGDKLVGTMRWPDQKGAKLKDVKLKDDTLTFSNVRKFMDNEFPIDYTLEIDGEKFKGKAATEFGGTSRSMTSEEKGEERQVERTGIGTRMEDQLGRTQALQQTGHAMTAFSVIRLISHELAPERGRWLRG